MHTSNERLVAFLPWLKLREAVPVGDAIRFVPFVPGDVQVGDELRDLVPSLTKIASSYVDLRGRPIERCTVTIVNQRIPPWNLAREDFEAVRWATSLLYLAASATNDYFQMIPRYVNRTMFELYWQRFIEPVNFVTLTARRRNGSLPIGGFRHGEIKVTVPVQSDSLDLVCIDTGFLRAISQAGLAGAKSVHRLKPALSFFSLATTDSDVMLPEAEAILLASAFETLLGCKGAYMLGKGFGELFRDYGGVIVDNALSNRPGIRIDREHEKDQRGWFVHRKWAEELHHLRSKYVHGEPLSCRQWGWQPAEHLVIGAFAFPLAVKAILREEGHYTLTRKDEVCCCALDLILAKTGWDKDNGTNLTVWQATVNEAKRKSRVAKAVRALEQEHSAQ